MEKEKNRLKLETRFLLYPSSMVKKVRISTFDFHSRFGDRHTSKDRRIWRVHGRFRFVCGQITWCIHNSSPPQ